MQIKIRYDMEDPVLSRLGVLRPKNALLAAYRDEVPSLLPLVRLLPRIVQENDNSIQVIDDQWRRLPMAKVRLPSDICTVKKLDQFWSLIWDFRSEGGIAEFKELATFALSALSLPHSNADCERVFSQV